jgi:hypothetical protein
LYFYNGSVDAQAVSGYLKPVPVGMHHHIKREEATTHVCIYKKD